MQNFDGAMNPFKIPLNSDGRVVMLADQSLTYDVYIKNSYGDLVCSRLNVECISPGNICINGADTRIKNTDGTLDVSLRTLGNNVREYTVNTNNKVLDLQAPLYFVENSNTATIIGVSGISGGGGQGGDGDPEVNYLVHANSATWNDVSAKLNTTAFSTVSGNFLTAIPDEYSTKDYVQSSVSSKLDSTAFSTVSGSFLTAHQDLSDYLTKNSADTLYQPSGNYADVTALDGKVDTSSFTVFSSTTDEKIEYISGALSGTYELSAGEGIDITDYPNEQKTVISVTAQGGNPEVSHDNTLSGNGTVASPLGVVPGYNETVLWSGIAITGTLTASESVLNFDHYKVYISERERGTPAVLEFHTENTATSGVNLNTSNGGFKAIALTMFQNTNLDFFTINSNHAVWNNSFTELSLSTSGWNKYMTWNSSGFIQWSNTEALPTIRIHKIVGINRKA
jgi:hypothetical protein